MNSRNRRFAVVLGLAATFYCCGCGLIPRRPHGVVSNLTHQEHPEFINGDMDWGSEVGFDVRNSSDRGTIHIGVSLSTSEGQWERSQDIVFEAGELRHFTFFFQEPSINATNYQAVVRVDP